MDGLPWVQIEERLPEDGQEVLVYHPDNGSDCAIWDAGIAMWKKLTVDSADKPCTFLWPPDHATHWMEIHPPAP
jgi:hypothetical protein